MVERLEGGVEHHVGGFSADAGSASSASRVQRNLAAMLCDEHPAGGDDVLAPIR
ncbi:MAG: hypothetical protein IPL58_12780 [Betaproteobacteria bacterium]|uniref:Uncharacterized protein n=1 Tax=Candidatus Proximibacter danicus TaxID=2954365 RepID=A0A9D7K5T7_9PROT|nr:hypothetical protein [Candidatus Proximibacter danicus]